MKEFFSFDSPFMEWLALIGDLMITNFLFLLFCLPVLTAGAALTALNRTVQGLLREERRGIAASFVTSFRENFRQSTLAWLSLLFFFASMGCNYLLISAFLSGVVSVVLEWMILAACIFVIAVSGFFFPLTARYQNTFREHLFHSTVLVIVKFPRAAILTVINLLPLLTAYFQLELFIYTLIFWLVIGFGLASYLSNCLLTPIFDFLESRHT